MSDVRTAVRRSSSSQGQESQKSKQFKLESSITVTSSVDNLDALEAVLSDEERKIGLRSSYTFTRGNNKITIQLQAKDAIALKAIVSSVSTLIKLVEDGVSI